MRLTRFTDYSLRVLMYVAARPDRQATVPEIAAAFGISASHLTKVVHHLGKKRLLTNVRGRSGGVGPASAEITLGAIVRATEPATGLVECFNVNTNACVITPVCRLRGVLAEALDAFYGVLDQHSLSGITGNGRHLQRALRMSQPTRTSEDKT